MEVPSIIYKYRAISAHTEELLSKREIYFPLASEINDPFDCQIILNRDAPPEVLWEKMKMHYGQKFGLSDEIEIVYRMLLETAPPGAQVTRNRAAEVIDKKEWMSLQNDIGAGNRSMLNARLSKTRLCSFSALRCNLIMWVHYADWHKGICLGFSTENTNLKNIYMSLSFCP